ncbi:MAG: hypothetical protein HRT88_22055 [Lentisphaeraceae bacterium]|nr:hypothetical protein [Lentisphaeraceae bacterium]
MKQLFLIALFAGILLPAAEFKTNFTDGVDRYFIAPNIWTNPMEAWKLRNGRLEVDIPQARLNAHCLTHQLKEGDGNFTVEVEVSALKGELIGAGINVGVRSELGDYRSSLLRGKGLSCGIDAQGKIFIGRIKGKKIPAVKNVRLLVSASQFGNNCQLTFKVLNLSGKVLASLTSKSTKLHGNIALSSNSAKKNKLAFDNWTISGSKISENKEQTFGPIMWTQYTLSRKVLKMTVLLAPIGAADSQICQFEVKKNGTWSSVAEALIHPHSRTAEFRFENWDDSKDYQYRITYTLKIEANKKIKHTWNGTVRRDPVDKNIALAGFTGNKDEAFPNALMAKNVAIQNPDVLFFSGDQIYEEVGGYGIIRKKSDASVVGYLRNYYLFGWAFRDIMKDRPTIILPDDHDVYQPNVWGNGGNKISMALHDSGGYNMDADFVNAVHRTQVSHHPDAFDPTPIQRGISVY